jgi:hypothetical protein
MVGGVRHLICKADILIAPGEQPEIISLTVMLLSEDAAQEGAFRGELAQVWCVVSAAEDLLNVLVFFDNYDDVIVYRQHRWPSEPLGSNCRRACNDHKHGYAQDFQHCDFSIVMPSLRALYSVRYHSGGTSHHKLGELRIPRPHLPADASIEVSQT